MSQPVGVIGSGSFGLTLSKLLSENVDVLLYTRRDETFHDINNTKNYLGYDIPERLTATQDIKEICGRCDLLFPVVPSKYFRELMSSMAPYLKPHHILIHGTKGLASDAVSQERFDKGDFHRKEIFAMSEVILSETPVLRVGCLSGPNLAKEILAGQPAATVIASPFDEVIKKGQEVLSSRLFSVFGSDDLKGAELAGAIKNIIAIGSGILGGHGLGKNMQAALITRGLREMIQFGEAMGASSTSFLGIAGIGDLIATATSESSRNYTFGLRLGKGEAREEIEASSGETIEGIRTLKIVYHLGIQEGLRLPIVTMLYKIVFEGFTIDKAIRALMTYTYGDDVDFI